MVTTVCVIVYSSIEFNSKYLEMWVNENISSQNSTLNIQRCGLMKISVHRKVMIWFMNVKKKLLAYYFLMFLSIL